jgi:hypothetical protein
MSCPASAVNKRLSWILVAHLSANRRVPALNRLVAKHLRTVDEQLCVEWMADSSSSSFF